jgi:uncharacterized membrane protein YfcA
VTWAELVILLVAGGAAGFINAMVGSGTLITFPVLLAMGVPPVVANVSNTVGLAPGSLSGALATRADLTGQRTRVIRLGTASLIGGIIGAALLLRLPSAAFDTIVPVLIGLGCLLVVTGPVISRRMAARRAQLGMAESSPRGSVWLWLGVLATGVYGGYFGAAQGVILIAILGIGLTESLTRANAIKNTLSLIVNGIAGVVFVLVAEVNWWAAAAIAVGSVLGAQFGGKVGRKIPPTVYRAVIVAVGVAAIINVLR